MFSNQLTHAQVERLALLAEEMGEAVQVIGKILRHGLMSCHPDDEDQRSNRMLLEKELGDVQYAVRLLCESRDIRDAHIGNYADDKAIRVKPYLHHQ